MTPGACNKNGWINVDQFSDLRKSHREERGWRDARGKAARGMARQRTADDAKENAGVMFHYVSAPERMSAGGATSFPIIDSHRCLTLFVFGSPRQILPPESRIDVGSGPKWSGWDRVHGERY